MHPRKYLVLRIVTALALAFSIVFFLLAYLSFGIMVYQFVTYIFLGTVHSIKEVAINFVFMLFMVLLSALVFNGYLNLRFPNENQKEIKEEV